MRSRVDSFSVVVPCYNAAGYVDKALRSAANQTFAPAEIIVVDDGSTDGSADVVRRSGVDVELIRTARSNGAAARNTGVQASRGQWIAFLDADDVWYSDHLASIRELVGDSGAIAHLNSTDTVHPTTDAISHRSPILPIPEARNDLKASDYFDACAGRCLFVGMSAFAVQRATFDDVGGFDERFVRRHDIDFWLRVMPGRRWAYDPVPSSAYRAGRAGNLSSVRASAKIFRLRALLKNRTLYDPAEIDPMIAEASAAAVEVARTEGSPADLELARALARSGRTV